MKRFVTSFGMFMLLFCAHAVFGGESSKVNSALFPAGDPTVFNIHARAEVKNHDSCEVCHPQAAGSKWASQRLVPDMDVCSPCHEAAKNVTAISPVTEQCALCHGDIPKGKRPVRGNYPRPNIRFTHQAHVSSAKCSVCHLRAAARLDRGKEPDMPNMKKCFNCHESGKGRPKCRMCHIVDKDGLLVTEYEDMRLKPPEWLVGPTHGVQWAGTHAEVAGADSDLCGSCHRESFCRDCHTGKLRPRNIHPSDWLSIHGSTARLDSPSCRGCHRKQTFCLACHRRAGVAPDSPFGARPPGEMGRYHGSMDNTDLMRQARRNIIGCVSCHSESSCITCHATRNPHPPGFRRTCRPLAVRNRRACSKCHNDEAWKRCI